MSISSASPDLARDPLNSPFPLPWQWILDTQAAVTAGTHLGQELYRSPSLYDPHHQFAAYCRVRLDLKPQHYDSRVTSTLSNCFKVSVGLLKRQLDGWLAINEVLVNELGHLLEAREYLKYHRALFARSFLCEE